MNQPIPCPLKWPKKVPHLADVLGFSGHCGFGFAWRCRLFRTVWISPLAQTTRRHWQHLCLSHIKWKLWGRWHALLLVLGLFPLFVLDEYRLGLGFFTCKHGRVQVFHICTSEIQQSCAQFTSTISVLHCPIPVNSSAVIKPRSQGLWLSTNRIPNPLFSWTRKKV